MRQPPDGSVVPQFSRRALLGAGVASGAAVLAGCAGVLGGTGASITEDWETRVPGTTGGITTHDGTAYVATENGLETLDVETGDRGWKFSTRHRRTSAYPVVDGSTIFVGTFSAPDKQPKLYAVTTAGKAEWSVALPGGVTTAAVADGTIFAASGVMGGDYGLYALDAETGDEEWRVSLATHPVGSSPAVSAGTVYIESGGFAAFDAESGDLDWRHERDETEIGEAAHYSPTVGEETVYFSYSMEPEVYAFDTATGEKQWRADVNARASQPLLDDGTLYVGTTNSSLDDPEGRVYALDAATGDERWSVTTGDVPLRGPVVRGETVYTAGSDTLYAITDGEISWSHTFESGISAPVVADEYLILDTPTYDSSHVVYGLR